MDSPSHAKGFTDNFGAQTHGIELHNVHLLGSWHRTQSASSHFILSFVKSLHLSSTTYVFDQSAIDTHQKSTECYVVSLFEDSQVCAIYDIRPFLLNPWAKAETKREVEGEVKALAHKRSRLSWSEKCAKGKGMKKESTATNRISMTHCVRRCSSKLSKKAQQMFIVSKMMELII